MESSIRVNFFFCCLVDGAKRFTYAPAQSGTRNSQETGRHDNQRLTSQFQVTGGTRRPRPRHFWVQVEGSYFWGCTVHTPRAVPLSSLPPGRSAPARAHTLARAVRVHANGGEDSVAYLLAREAAGNLRPPKPHRSGAAASTLPNLVIPSLP